VALTGVVCCRLDSRHANKRLPCEAYPLQLNGRSAGRRSSTTYGREAAFSHAMKSCRRAWNVVARRHPGKLPHVNPFAQMGLRSSNRETPTATYNELLMFRAKAVELGLSSLATAALVGWEWLQRETDIFATFDVSHYRPKERPNMVLVVDEKTKQESWIPLLDDAGAPIYPELMAELDAIKRDRIGGLMLCRDWGNRGPWPTWPKPDQPDFTHLSRKVKQVVRAAELRDELSFTSFRHGGFTEGWRRRIDRPRDASSGPPYDREGTAEVHQAHHSTDR
jgi:hypothetical protein